MGLSVLPDWVWLMEIWLLTTAPAVLAAALVGLLVHLRGAARFAAATTERDLLRDRVRDLEAALAEDAETAAALRPVHESIARVERQVAVLERDRVDQFSAVRSALLRVEDETSALGRHTASLAGSLNASSVRGAWGEVQLRRVLEHAGMLSRCDFEEQVAATSQHGRAVRPDVVVRLPGGRVLVVDAKAPMTAFLQAQGEDVEASERSALLADHARALTGHVDALAAKDYWSAFTTSPEAVLCFVPSDAMLSSALAADPGLHERAMAKRVVVVGPGALLAVLRSVAFTWQQDALATNAEELLVVGRELYARLATLGGHAAKLGRSLTGSVEAYNALIGGLEARVLVSARRLHDLGIGGSELTQVGPVTAAARPLTAYELIDAVTATDRRPELLVDPPAGTEGEMAAS